VLGVRVSAKRHYRLLTSPEMRESILTIARSHSVPESDLEDVYQETIAKALVANLPEDEEETRLYVNRIAANVSMKHSMGLNAHEFVLYVEDPDLDAGEVATNAAVQAVAYEDREAVERLVAKGRQKFPRWFSIFVSARLSEQSSEEVARRHKVSSAHIRHEWSSIGRFVRKYGPTVGVGLGVLTALAFGLGLLEWRRRASDFSEYATYEAHRVLPPAPDASELRRRGIAACNAQAWQACVDDLDAANALDAAGENWDLYQLRYAARKNARHEQFKHDKPVAP
jgi:DNA-directed RNA polymerase specialized sigma24 family protein